MSHLRQEIEQKAADAAADKSRWAGELAEIVLARQIEVANLTGALHEAKERAHIDHEEIRRLSAEMEIVRESLRGSEGQLQAQHDTVASLRQEIADLQAQVEASEKKVAQAGAGAMSKGGGLSRGNGLPYLPNDVLSKWIGRG